MKFTKQRLEAFTDGVIAIIITIMVLSIPLPGSFKSGDLWGFVLAILIYMLSFIVVAAFWVQHHRALSFIDEVTHRVIACNFMFLFFLSLIPVLTKWVIESPGMLLPAIGYDIVFVLVYLCFNLILHYVAGASRHERVVKIAEYRKARRDSITPRDMWLRFVSFIAIFGVIIFLSVRFPKISTLFLLGIPVLASFFNLFFEDFHRHEPAGDKSAK